MMQNNKIVKRFNQFQSFLSSLDEEDRKCLISLKMMYSVHLSSYTKKRKEIVLLLSLFRMFIKLISIPFLKFTLLIYGNKSFCAILKHTSIEEYISKTNNISLCEIKKRTCINKKTFIIYKNFALCFHKLLKSDLSKIDILILAHRLIDYISVYSTLEIKKTNTIFIENDRSPINLALINRCKETNIQTVKYDNWLIDPINHNDVYCEYYYYPSIYHKQIIQKLNTNHDLKYLEGGFMYWDKIATYSLKKLDNIISIVYFTQFGIALDEHARYIKDISEIMSTLGLPFQLKIKVHPKENQELYKKHFINHAIVEEYINLYELIASSNFCFSIFSTVSLEAKHLIQNSYFINYNYSSFNLLDYNALKLDLIKNKEMLFDVLTHKYTPISQELFIKQNNLMYPQSTKKIIENFCHE